MDIETLNDAWGHGVRLAMRCAHGPRDGLKHRRECNFSADLDVLTLLCTRGPNFPVGRLAERLMCPRCGSRQVRILMGLPTNHSAARAKGGRPKAGAGD